MVYFGTDTSKGGAKGIYAARFDAGKGQFATPVLAAECRTPSFLALGRVRDRRLLYSVNEGDERTSGVSTYAMDGAGGALRLLGQVPSGGASPCFLSLHPDGRNAYVANYTGGSVSAYKVQADGTLSAPIQTIDFRKGKVYGQHGPNAERQEGSHPHAATISPDGRYLIVCDLGHDDFAVFPIADTTGELGPVHLSESVAGSGPRHVAFHPNGRWVYGIDELTSKINQYLWNEVHGTAGIATQGLLTDTSHTVSTLDPGYTGKNTAAEIQMGPYGHFVYASNRGEDSLVVFSADAARWQADAGAENLMRGKDAAVLYAGPDGCVAGVWE